MFVANQQRIEVSDPHLIEQSVDGVNWAARPPAVVTDWGNHSYKGGPFESGGCAYVAAVKKWYCLNGFRGSWMSVDGARGMGTFVSDSPGGPWKPLPAYKAMKNKDTLHIKH